jgi:hypothetical protein
MSVVKVPASAKMDNEIFRLHLEKRHVPDNDFDTLTGFHPGQTFVTNRATLETYHTYLHERKDYSHVHSDD